MSGKVRIVILDDDEVRARDDWAAKIKRIEGIPAAAEVEALTALEVAQCLRQLQERALEARQEAQGSATHERCVVDDADIVIMDYDLTPDPTRIVERHPEQVELIRSELRAETAETLAYLARCYSSCKFIVAVNQHYRRRTFDVTFNRFAESWADLNISQDDIGSPELWTGDGNGFHPWSWPRLLDAGQEFDRRLALVELERPVLDALGFLPLDEKSFDVSQLDLFADQPNSVTFREVAESSDSGLALRDKQEDETALRRIAAAAIGHWLDNTILQAQNVLVDAPHLAYRVPSLLLGDPKRLDSWNSTVSFDIDNIGLDLEKLSGKIIPACDWFQRPVWAWNEIASDNSIPEVASPWSSENYDYVFCEDISRFARIEDAQEIQTDLPGPYDRRFIKGLDVNIAHYVPLTRILG